MLRTLAVALLATAMSDGLADAKGAKPKPKALPYCQTEQQAKDKACGPAKTVCQKGMWCHAFTSACGP